MRSDNNRDRRKKRGWSIKQEENVEHKKTGKGCQEDTPRKETHEQLEKRESNHGSGFASPSPGSVRRRPFDNRIVNQSWKSPVLEKVSDMLFNEYFSFHCHSRPIVPALSISK